MKKPIQYTLDDFDFDLPAKLIAQYPCPQRSASRLLNGLQVPSTHHIFKELPTLLSPGDLLVFNDTQVIKARLYGRKASGGALELLVERILAGTHDVWAHVRASKSPSIGARLTLGDERQNSFEAQVLGRCGPDNSLFHLRFPKDPLLLLSTHGHVPLPPYINHPDTAEDESRYQTIFAAQPGAVAAPTASLHFDEAVLSGLSERGILKAKITLHVGAGTFQPVRTPHLAEHRMHSEWFDIPESTATAIQEAKARGARVIAAGTTTLRALESAAKEGGVQAMSGDTDIFITPGFDFQVVDQLITNFHLPKSTLMMLVSAFAGHSQIHSIYQEAICKRYRFFSYGDAMLLGRSRC